MISQGDVEKREKTLRMAMEKVLPDLVKSCRENIDPLIIHQDAFAVDYDEYELLGMAIKCAGWYGKEIRIIGKNRETLRAAAANWLRSFRRRFGKLFRERFQNTKTTIDRRIN